MTHELIANDNFSAAPSAASAMHTALAEQPRNEVMVNEAEVIHTLKSMRLLNVWKKEINTASNHFINEHPMSTGRVQDTYKDYTAHPFFSTAVTEGDYVSDALIAMKHMGYATSAEDAVRIHDIVAGREKPQSPLAHDMVDGYAKALAVLSHELHAGRPSGDEDRAHFTKGLHDFEREDCLDPLSGQSKLHLPYYAAMYQIGDALAQAAGIAHNQPEVRARAMANADVLAEERSSVIAK